MIEEIRQEVVHRGITRICHFTPSRNLIHIACDEFGIQATSKLREDQRMVFTATDPERIDGCEDYICCSIQYPNAWYLDKARAKEVLFKDWVVLLISPDYLWQSSTLFCPRNAAAGHGILITKGADAFTALFRISTVGAYGKTFTRCDRHLVTCPTDNQAEVLVHEHIRQEDILGVAVGSESQAKDEIAAIRIATGLECKLQFVVAPDFYNKHKLSTMISAGQYPNEMLWTGSR